MKKIRENLSRNKIERNCSTREYNSKETWCRYLEESNYKAHDENNNKLPNSNITKVLSLTMKFHFFVLRHS